MPPASKAGTMHEVLVNLMIVEIRKFFLGRSEVPSVHPSLFNPTLQPNGILADENLGVPRELVRWYLKIQWRWSLPNPSRHVVVASMARTEPPVVVPGPTDRDASKVGAYSQHHKPLRFQSSVVIGLLVAEAGQRHAGLGADLGRGAVADKNGLAPPLDSDGLPHRDAADVELRGCKGKDVGRGAHGTDELDHEDSRGGRVGEPHAGQQEVREGAPLRLGNVVDPIVRESVVDGSQLVELRRLGRRRRRRDECLLLLRERGQGGRSCGVGDTDPDGGRAGCELGDGRPRRQARGQFECVHVSTLLSTHRVYDGSLFDLPSSLRRLRAKSYNTYHAGGSKTKLLRSVDDLTTQS